MFSSGNPIDPLLVLLAALKLELPFSVGLENNNVNTRFMCTYVSVTSDCLHSLKSVD